MKSTNNLLLGSYFTYRSYKCYNQKKLSKTSNQEYTLINHNSGFTYYETWIVSPNSTTFHAVVVLGLISVFI